MALHEPLAVALARALAADEVRETHGSWVVLTAENAYKLKKPVRFGFLDFSTPEARRRACEEEVRVNRELAGDVVLGVVSVVPTEDGVRLGDADDPTAVDWVVAMRRFDEDRTMAALARRGILSPTHAQAVGRTIARFHAGAAVVAGREASTQLQAAWRRNLDELRLVARGDLRSAVEALEAFAEAGIRRRARVLDERGDAGLVREGHGDLRAEHVLLEDGVTIVDRLEFDRALREIDVADDLAFLLMDLEALGVRWAADEVLAGYRAAGGDAGDDALLAFFGAYRAAVRAKVELLRASQLVGGASALRGDERARGLLRLAEHLAWRARPAMPLVVCGPPGSGKSHLAQAIAVRTRAVVLSSDAVRKELLGLPLDAPAPVSAYAPAERARVYAELAARVNALPAEAPVVVDATFGSRDLRDAFVRPLPPDRVDALRWVECRAPLATLVARARARASRDRRGSDAGPDVAGRLAAGFQSLDDVAPLRRTAVDGAAPTSVTLRELGVWLDRSSDEHAVARARARGGVVRPVAEA